MDGKLLSASTHERASRQSPATVLVLRLLVRRAQSCQVREAEGGQRLLPTAARSCLHSELATQLRWLGKAWV